MGKTIFAIVFLCFFAGCSKQTTSNSPTSSRFVSEEKMKLRLSEKYEQQLKVVPHTALEHFEVGMAYYNLGVSDAALEKFLTAKELFISEGELGLARDMDKYINLTKRRHD